MKFEKKGLIYCPDGKKGWDVWGFMTPHAMLIGDFIRIWGGIRDEKGVSRISYIDVSADNPSEVLAMAEEPALDIGKPGCFDDNGMILGDVIQKDGKLFLYYVGFQHVEKVKFYAFSGVAISNDMGKHFVRHSEVPIMDRTNTGRYGRCIHTVLPDNGIYKVFYAVINDWEYINHIPYPIYDIWCTESEDGVNIPRIDDKLCVTTNKDEYRIGRPKVYKTETGYEMFYTRDFISKDYVIGNAESNNGFDWDRIDDKDFIPKSELGWDSEMTCYPVKLTYKNKEYIFYNGNGMGKSGIGYAVRENNTKER